MVCELFTNSSLDSHSLLVEIFKGLTVYANFTGQTKCLDVNQIADQSLGDLGWDFQARLRISTSRCILDVKDR